jgi:hypothetical protein
VVTGIHGPIVSDDVLAAAAALGHGPIGFTVVRNEMLRLGAWLAHYRKLGIERFVVVDNGSTDGTYERLVGESDVVAVRAAGKHSYAHSNCGIEWLAELHRGVPPGTWILLADADELMIFRGWPARPLADLLTEAEHEGANAVFAFMLDMYPDGPLEGTAAAADPIAAAACFDADYVFRRPPSRPWHGPSPGLEVLGGPRLRMLSTLAREQRSNWVDYLIRGQFDRILPLTPDALLPLLVRLMPRQMPALAKYPLVKSGDGVAYLNPHTCTGTRLFQENVVLLHYKFLHDFAARVAVECVRHEHFRRGSEYIMYAQMLRRHGHLDLRYGGTRRFAGAEQLLELSLIRNIGALVSGPGGSQARPAGREGAAEPCRSSDRPARWAEPSRGG